MIINSTALGRSSSMPCPICNSTGAKHFLSAPDRFHGRTALHHLSRCDRCGLVTLVDPPLSGEMADHYGEAYHRAIETAGDAAVSRRWRRQLRTVRSFKSGGALLDVGCSSGAFLEALRGKEWKLYGIEMSEREAERARTTTGAKVFNGDPLDAPFEPETFDAITCFHLLEHVYQPVELLKRFHNWLKPDGILYIVLPNIECWEASMFRTYWFGLELPRHLFHFSPASLQRAFDAAHLQTHRLRTLVDDSFCEHSIGYVTRSFLLKCGIAQAPLSAGLPASLPLKVFRKSFRLTAESLFRYAAAACGRGALLEALCTKKAE